MLMADTVMDADEPRFQIGEDEMDDRQIVLGNLWVAALGNGKVFIPALAEAGISTPIVSDGQRPRSNGALHEPTKRVGAPIGYYGEPDTPGIASVLSLVLRGSRFPMTNLDGTSDENLVVDTPAFAASPSTNPCLVYLNMFPRLAADTILIGPHHASAELVENAEGRLIARQAKLSLKLNRRDAGRLAGDQISRPKPCAQRHMAAFHDGANRQARIVAALATAQDTGTSGDAEGIACGMAMRTDEAVATWGSHNALGKKLHYWFEAGDTGQKEAKRFIGRILAHPGTNPYFLNISRGHWESKDDVPAFCSADLLAWEWRRSVLKEEEELWTQRLKGIVHKMNCKGKHIDVENISGTKTTALALSRLLQGFK